MSEGKQGKQGIRGYEGVQGIQGETGSGERGAPGKKGADANPGRTMVSMFIVLGLVVIGMAWALTNHFADTQTQTQIGICERTKADRVDTARALTAMAKYYDGVIAAESVQQDVKDHAARVQDLVFESANQLRARILLCGPLIREDLHTLDERLLREARGGI